ncbi:MAG TPA: hypothetical protein VGN95_23315 [Pyrinomonadaceae bacterium]|nr:hypothetical protein [Pyrinomonadaceae bacterium]
MADVHEVSNKRAQKHLDLLASIEMYRKKYGRWPVPLEIRKRLRHSEQHKLYRIEREEAIYFREEKGQPASRAGIASSSSRRPNRKGTMAKLLGRAFDTSHIALDAILNIIFIVCLIWAFLYILWLVIQAYLT